MAIKEGPFMRIRVVADKKFIKAYISGGGSSTDDELGECSSPVETFEDFKENGCPSGRVEVRWTTKANFSLSPETINGQLQDGSPLPSPSFSLQDASVPPKTIKQDLDAGSASEIKISISESATNPIPEYDFNPNEIVINDATFTLFAPSLSNQTCVDSSGFFLLAFCVSAGALASTGLSGTATQAIGSWMHTEFKNDSDGLWYRFEALTYDPDGETESERVAIVARQIPDPTVT